MAYKTVVRVDVRCPNHLRFHPERDGPGAIKGNCSECLSIWEIYAALRKVIIWASSDGLRKPVRPDK